MKEETASHTSFQAQPTEMSGNEPSVMKHETASHTSSQAQPTMVSENKQTIPQREDSARFPKPIKVSVSYFGQKIEFSHLNTKSTASELMECMQRKTGEKDFYLNNCVKPLPVRSSSTLVELYGSKELHFQLLFGLKGGSGVTCEYLGCSKYSLENSALCDAHQL